MKQRKVAHIDPRGDISSMTKPQYDAGERGKRGVYIKRNQRKHIATIFAHMNRSVHDLRPKDQSYTSMSWLSHQLQISLQDTTLYVYQLARHQR
jgi:hypothetical protein